MPTRGMERWLAQRMSDRLGASPGRADGVCANVDFPSPRRLVGDAVAIASGIDADTDPWLPERAVWPLLEVVEERLGEPWLAALSHHLGGPGPAADPVRRARRLATLRHLAELFDRYALHRPAMVRAWAAGTTTTAPAASWATRALAARALAAAARADRRRGHRRARRRRVRAAAGAAGAARPPAATLASSGSPGCPPGTCRSCSALADGRDVHLFLLHPSPGLWDRDRAGGRPAGRAPRRGPHRRAAGQPAAVVLGRRRARDAARARRGGARWAPPPGRRTAPTRCWAASRPTSTRIASRPARRCPAGSTSARCWRRRPQRPGPRLPRTRAPGRGPARRDPPPARGRPDPRAPRRHRHVPRHRDVRARSSRRRSARAR